MAWNAVIRDIQAGRVAFGYVLTQEARARKCNWFLSSFAKFEKVREKHGEELTGLQQTQRMAAAVHPCRPPPTTTLLKEHMQQFPVQMKKSFIYPLGLLFPNAKM